MKKNIVLSVLIALSCTMASVAMEQGDQFNKKRKIEESEEHVSLKKNIPSLKQLSIDVFNKTIDQYSEENLLEMIQLDLDPVIQQNLVAVLAKRLARNETLDKFNVDQNYRQKFDGFSENLSKELGCAIMKARPELTDILFEKLISKKLIPCSWANYKNTQIYHQNGKTFLASGYNNIIFIYDISDKDNIILKQKLSDHKANINSLAVYQQGAKIILATGSCDRTVCVYDISNLDKILFKKQFSDSQDWINSLSIWQHKNTTILSVVSYDGKIYFYDISDLDNIIFKRQFSDPKYKYGIISQRVYQQGTKTILVTGSYDGSICFYDISDLGHIVLKKPFLNKEGSVLSQTIYQSGTKTILATGHWNGAICIYDISDHENIIFKEKLAYPGKRVDSLIISSCGTKMILAAGFSDGTICIYTISDLDNIHFKNQFKYHDSLVSALVIYQFETSAILASGSYDGMICLCDISDLDSIGFTKKLSLPKTKKIDSLRIYQQAEKTSLTSMSFGNETVSCYDLTEFNTFLEFAKNKITLHQALLLLKDLKDNEPLDLKKLYS